MASRGMREFQCEVVNEKVLIGLRKKPTGGLNSKHVLFVKCNQDECQYIDSNKLPCPLDVSLFAEETRARDEAARRRSNGFEDE